MTDPSPDLTPSKENPVAETNPNAQEYDWLQDLFTEPDPDDSAPALTPEEAPYGVTANGRPVPGGFTGTLPAFLAWVEEQLAVGTLSLTEVRTDLTGQKVQVVTLTTGGWSDDEAFLRRIPHNSLFGWLFWESTHSGGLTVYEVPVLHFSSGDVHEWMTPPSDVFESVHHATTLVIRAVPGDERSEELRVDLPHGAQLRFRETENSSAARSGELIVEPLARTREPWCPDPD